MAACGWSYSGCSQESRETFARSQNIRDVGDGEQRSVTEARAHGGRTRERSCHEEH